jgi:hypothetical protein
MPKPKSSDKASTTEKIITAEMVTNLTVQQLYDLRMQGWAHENPVKDRRELVPKLEKGNADDPVTYYGSVGLQRKEAPADAMENDPELRELADRLGVQPKDLLMLREMMLDRYGHRYSEDEE